MVLTVLVSADLFGTKVNYEVDFASPPSIAEFQGRVAALFDAEGAPRRPAHVPAAPFQIQRMQCFDDRVELWVDLVAGGQLRDFTQVYVFQPETPWHTEVQSKIPPPMKPAAAPPPAPLLPAPPLAPPPPPMPAPPYSAALAGALVPHRSPHRSPRGSAPSLYGSDAASLLPLPHHMPAPAAAPPAAVPLHCDKVRRVYEDLLREGPTKGTVDKDTIAAVLLKLRIHLEACEPAELFRRADTDADGALSLDEFARFAEIYPTLLDSLYYRSRDWWIDQRQQEAITQARAQLASMIERAQAAGGATAAAAADVQQQQLKVDLATAEGAAAEGRQGDALGGVEAARAATEKCRAEAAQRARDVAAARDRERPAEAAQAEAARGVEAAAARHRAAKEEAARADQRLADLRALLAQQEAEAARQRDAEATAGAAVSQAEGAAAVAAAEVSRAKDDTKRALGTLQAQEAELGRLQDMEREACAAHLQTREDAARQAARRDTEERELRAAKERESQQRVVESEAQRGVDAQQRVLAGLEEENREHAGARARAEESERGLINSEVRLRLQREQLEQEEAALRSDHRSFHSSSNRTGAPGVSLSAASAVRPSSPFRAR